MKLIVLSILILIFYYFTRSREESYAITADNVFKQVEIPDASKDPYYQKIKNMTFDCGIKCPEGQKVDTSGSCVCINNDEEVVNGVCKCKQGLTRGPNGVCYPPCLDGQTRDFDGVCKWLPCPVGQTRNIGGDNKCYPPCPFTREISGWLYDEQYRGYDGKCYFFPCMNGGTRRDDGVCIPNCTSDQTYDSILNVCNCKDPNRETPPIGSGKCTCKPPLVDYGDKCGPRCEYYQTYNGTKCVNVCYDPAKPYFAVNKICYKDFAAYLDDINPCPSREQTHNSLGECVWKPCPIDKTRNLSNGVCEWNPCPVDQIRDFTVGSSTYEKCIFNNCPSGQERNTKGDNKCYPLCGTDKERDSSNNCVWKPCGSPEQYRDTYGNCLWKPCSSDMKIRNSSGMCVCKPEYYPGYGMCFASYSDFQTASMFMGYD